MTLYEEKVYLQNLTDFLLFYFVIFNFTLFLWKRPEGFFHEIALA